jgi:hypothetical protein
MEPKKERPETPVLVWYYQAPRQGTITAKDRQEVRYGWQDRRNSQSALPSPVPRRGTTNTFWPKNWWFCPLLALTWALSLLVANYCLSVENEAHTQFWRPPPPDLIPPHPFVGEVIDDLPVDPSQRHQWIYLRNGRWIDP